MAVTTTKPTRARLRRSDLSVPGLARRRRGRGWQYLDSDDAAVRDEEVLRAHRRAGDPAGVDRRLDLPVPGRPHPGHGHRRGGPQAVPLPPALARAPRPAEVRRHDRLRARAAGPARARRGRPGRSRRRAHPRPGAGRGGAPARPRLLPHRLRGLRRDQRDLRAGHDAQGARDGLGRDDELRLPGQVGQAARAVGRGSPDRRAGDDAQASPRRGRRAAGLSRRPPLGRRPVRRHQRLPEGRHRRGHLGQGLPHVGRDRAGRGRGGDAIPATAPRRRRPRASGSSRGRSRRSPSTWATRPPSRAPPTSIRASSTAIRTG